MGLQPDDLTLTPATQQHMRLPPVTPSSAAGRPAQPRPSGKPANDVAQVDTLELGELGLGGQPGCDIHL